MNIQKKKLVSILVKIQALKNKYTKIQYLSITRQFTQCLLILYFIFTHGNMAPHNTIFTFCKQIHLRLLQFDQLSFILGQILLIISLFILASILVIALILSKTKDQHQSLPYRNITLKFTIILLILFDFSALLTIIGIISNFSLKNLTQIQSLVVNFFGLAMAQVIIFFSSENNLYSYRLTFILIACKVVGGIFVNFIFIMASAFELYYTQSNKLSYLVLLTINFIIFLGGIFQANISELQIIAVISIVILIYIYSSTYTNRSQQDQNDFLLLQLNKLRRQQRLSSKQINQVLFILQQFAEEYQCLLNIQQNIKLKSVLNQITMQNLSQILLIKLQKNQSIKQSDLRCEIQQLQCQLIQNAFDIKTIYTTQKLKCKVIQKGEYKQLLKMQQLINLIEVNELKNDSNIDGSFVIGIQKYLERFYYCIGGAIEQLIDLWTSLTKKSIKEVIFTQSLYKVVELQEQAYHILLRLKKYKNLSFQIEVLNYLHKIINADGYDMMQNEGFTSNIKLNQTHFILVSNNTIEEVSQIINNKISPYQSLIGKDINQILYSFYTQFMQSNITNLISLTQTHQEVLIPFKIYNHRNTFMLAKCTFTVLSSLDQGVKYIIKFIDHNQNGSKFLLYCLEYDKIKAFSQNFLQTYKIDYNSLPEIFQGHCFFNTNLSSLLNEEMIVVDNTIKCQLKLSNFTKQRKSTKAFIKQISFPINLTIKDIYNRYNQRFILFEILNKNEPFIPSTRQCLNKLNEQTISTNTNIECKAYCKIANPYESLVDQRLSRIKNKTRISYYKILIFFTVLQIIVIAVTIVFMKIKTQMMNDSFRSLLSEVNRKNSFIQSTYEFFYQYYQYYQISNYPNQLMQINNYNISVLTTQYYSKVNANIFILLPYIFTHNQKNKSPKMTLYFNIFNEQVVASSINLVEFLQNAKKSLADNSPLFMVRNQQAINSIVSNLKSFSNQLVVNFYNLMLNFTIGIIILILVLGFIMRFTYIKVCLFKFKVYQVYSSIQEQQINLYKSKLKIFADLLVNSKYYSRKEIVDQNGMDQQNSCEGTKQQNKNTGIEKDGSLQVMSSNNIISLIVTLALFFFIIYNTQVKTIVDQSLPIIQYAAELQALSMAILQRTTDYYHIGMQTIIDKQQRKGWRKNQVLRVPTQLTVQLPPFFNNYKLLQQDILQQNICKYSHLNTGQLYKGIDCSAIFYGIAANSFGQTYSFLLQKIQELGGIELQQFGDQYRPGAVYPFFMEVSYTRRTINNILAYLQAQFALTLNEYMMNQQQSIQQTIDLGFILLPIFMTILFIFRYQIKAECKFVIKCFKILPRHFIMKIGVSKKLKSNGILDQIEYIAI